jgi:hypothetical protein
LRAQVSIDGFCYGAALIIGNFCRPSRARSCPCAGRNDLPVRWLYGSAFGPFLMSACGFSAAHAARPRGAAHLPADPTRQSAGSPTRHKCANPHKDARNHLHEAAAPQAAYHAAVIRGKRDSVSFTPRTAAREEPNVQCGSDARNASRTDRQS